MIRAPLFRFKGLQAVRLPDNVSFPESVHAVAFLREGQRRVIVPADHVWDDFFDAPGINLGDRDQPA